MNNKPLGHLFVLVIAILFCAFSNAEAVWVDVRSALEHKVDNIEGDIRISYGDVVEQLTKSFPDKDTDIRLYCRSGGRAGKAQSALKSAGYTAVTNVGSINDARKERGLSY